jgi:hypothetical protein
MRGDKQNLPGYFAIKAYQVRYLESHYGQFLWLEEKPSCNVSDYLRVTTTKNEHRFFLRVFGVVGILIYVGQNASLDNT